MPTVDDAVDTFYYEVARGRLDAQLAQVDAIDSKASTMFTIGGAVLPISASLLTIM